MVKAEQDAERAAEQKTLKAPPLPEKYDAVWLNAGWQYEEATGKVLINPRYLDANALLLWDTEWRRDLSRYRAWLKFERDRKGGKKK